ncbi:hypothetical protein KPH14_007719 [Odynerus spinipes]|uniref:Exoribonuclease phosphorolytic domain-containing protein n=1 Tax=Odynerus spinipes TaxID=1348599 RepID=A0AAD9RJJ1_9HYME|nr:hypothetical protein KPH14_007719 [Odynerus spinipes]
MSTIKPILQTFTYPYDDGRSHRQDFLQYLCFSLLCTEDWQREEQFFTANLNIFQAKPKSINKMEENIPVIECKLRPMLSELNQLSMPDGSAMLMQGDTAVMAGIYGPVEPKAQKMIYDKASVEVVYSPVKGPPKVDDRVVELYIRESCEAAIIVMLHPGTAISINVQEIQDDGGLLACTINSACLALINSGISMRFTIAAVTCMIDESTGEVILDPDNNHLQSARTVFTFTYDSINKDVISCHTTGRFTDKEFLECMNKCRQASVSVFDFYRDIVKKYAKVI